MIGLTIDGIEIGDAAEITRVASDSDIADFVNAVGDHNPIHADRQYAATTMFKEPIAPGIWTAGLISAVIGTRLPGPGAIYLSQDLKFLRPVMFGDSITTRVEVADVNRERNRLRLRTVCTNQRGEQVLTGEALVMPSRVPVTYDRPAAGRVWTAFWALGPWAWAAQALALGHALGSTALAAAGLSPGLWSPPPSSLAGPSPGADATAPVSRAPAAHA
jgi:acyl dehydratase